MSPINCLYIHFFIINFQYTIDGNVRGGKVFPRTKIFEEIRAFTLTFQVLFDGGIDDTTAYLGIGSREVVDISIELE